MIKFLAAVMVSLVLFSGCTEPQTVCGTLAPTYGLANQSKSEVPGVKYRVSFGSVALAVVLSASLIVPIIVLGWDLFEPIPGQNTCPSKV